MRTAFDTEESVKSTVKTSEMIIEFAGDFIEMGDSTEQRQSRHLDSYL